MTAYLNKHERNQLAHALSFTPEKVKAELVGLNHAKFQQRFSESFDATTGAVCPVCHHDFRTDDFRVRLEACKTYGAFLGMLGPQSQIIVQLNASLGVKNEDELRELVDAGRAYLNSQNDVTLTPDALFPRALEMLVICAPKMPPAVVRSAAQRLLSMCEGSTNGDGAPYLNGEG